MIASRGGRRAVVAAAIVLAGCGESRRAPRAEGSGSTAAREPAISPELARLPGAIWYVADGPPRALVRLAGGARREWSSPPSEPALYPSARALPDGRLVAIASRGDGGPESEQLALLALDGAPERIGPLAAQVRDPALDRAGKWIVVAANTDGHSDLYRIDLEAGATTRLTHDPAGNFAPAPLDAETIVFASSRDGNSEIYRMRIDGGDVRRLTAFHRDDWQPSPSPDGATIAFASDREGPPRIFLMAADGTKQRRLTSRTGDRDELDPVWSPDGRSIAYVVQGRGEATIWIRDVATGAERALTPPNARDAEPTWSPDGAWVAVSRDGELWAIPIAAGEPLRLTTSEGLDRLPRWL